MSLMNTSTREAWRVNLAQPPLAGAGQGSYTRSALAFDSGSRWHRKCWDMRETKPSNHSAPKPATDEGSAAGGEIVTWTMLLRNAYRTSSLTECKFSLRMILLR